jgi:hypothetical protein
MKKITLLVILCLLFSCTVQYNSFKGFKKNFVYENTTELFLRDKRSTIPRYLAEVLESDKKYTSNFFPKGQKIVIIEIFRTYPDSSGVTHVYGEVITGKFKGEIITICVYLDSSYFRETTP